jgi:predicted aspartyl protease
VSIFRVPFEVVDASGRRSEPLEGLVDTGATFTWIRRDVLEKLGYEPEEQWEFELADGRRTLYGIKWVTVRLDGREGPTPFVFGEEGTEPLLGVFTLEGFRLGVDAVNERLIQPPAMLKVFR